MEGLGEVESHTMIFFRLKFFFLALKLICIYMHVNILHQGDKIEQNPNSHHNNHPSNNSRNIPAKQP